MIKGLLGVVADVLTEVDSIKRFGKNLHQYIIGSVD